MNYFQNTNVQTDRCCDTSYTKITVVALDTSRPTESKASFHHHYVMLSCYFGIVQENIDDLSLICIFTVFKNLFTPFQVCRL